ncbi:MAG: translocation/assembly module TamB domain-containing protein, partial [Myxococcota bacterium]
TLAFRFETARLDRVVMLATGTQVAELEGGLVVALAVELPANAPPRLAVEVAQAEFRWRGHAIRSLEPIRARLDGEALTLESVYLGIDGGADELFVAGKVVLENDPRLDLHLQADLGVELVRPFVGDLELGGQLSLLADLGGTATAPELRGQGEWSDARFVPPTLPHVFDEGRALVLLYPNALVLDRLAGQFAGGEVDANGRVDFATGAPSSYRFELRARRFALRWPPGWQTRGDADLALSSTAAGRQITGVARFDRVYYFQDIDLSATELLERILARSRVVLPETDELLAATSLNVAMFADESLRVRNNVADLQASASLTLRGSLARPVVFGEVATLSGGHVDYAGNRYDVERGLLTFADPTRIDPQLDVVARTKVDAYDVTFQLGGSLSRQRATFASDPPLADLEILALLTTGAPPDSALLS